MLAHVPTHSTDIFMTFSTTNQSVGWSKITSVFLKYFNTEKQSCNKIVRANLQSCEEQKIDKKTKWERKGKKGLVIQNKRSRLSHGFEKVTETV